MKSQINLDEFQKVELRVGEVLSVEKVPETDKLLRLMVNIGDEKLRQIISGISLHFPDPTVLIGKRYVFVTNLEPRAIRGFESQGMILSVSTDDGQFSLLEPSGDVPPGTKAK